MIDDNIRKVPENDETADFDEIDVLDRVSVEDALQAFMKVDPKKVKKAEEKAARRKLHKGKIKGE